MKTRYHYDDSEDKLIIETLQDVEPILNANKRQYDVDNRRFKSETLNHVARIPLVVIEKWCREKGMSYETFMADTEMLKRFLNDPDNKFLRTKPGKI